MDKLSSKFLEILKWDVIVAIVVGIFVQVIFGRYALSIIVGMNVAFINLIINTVVSTASFKKFSGFTVLIFILSYLLRILFSALIGYVIFTYNIYNALAYSLGYTFHFISLIVISFRDLRNNERK